MCSCCLLLDYSMNYIIPVEDMLSSDYNSVPVGEGCSHLKLAAFEGVAFQMWDHLK